MGRNRAGGCDKVEGALRCVVDSPASAKPVTEPAKFSTPVEKPVEINGFCDGHLV